MKTFRIATFIAVLSAVILLVSWNILLSVDLKRAREVSRSLCKELQAYRQRTGHLPPSLGLLADGNGLGADWLSNLTNKAAVTYDPGSSDRMPSLSVNYGHAWIAVAGPDFEH